MIILTCRKLLGGLWQNHKAAVLILLSKEAPAESLYSNSVVINWVSRINFWFNIQSTVFSCFIFMFFSRGRAVCYSLRWFISSPASCRAPPLWLQNFRKLEVLVKLSQRERERERSWNLLQYFSDDSSDAYSTLYLHPHSFSRRKTPYSGWKSAYMSEEGSED